MTLTETVGVRVSVGPTRLYLADWDPAKVISIGAPDRKGTTAGGTSFRSPSSSQAREWAEGTGESEHGDECRIGCFSFPNHFYERFWLLDLDQVVTSSPWNDGGLMADIADFLGVVDSRLTKSALRHVCIAGDGSNVQEPGGDVLDRALGPSRPDEPRSAKGCAAWINVDEQNHYALISLREPGGDTAGYGAGQGEGVDAGAVVRLTLRPREGFIWSRDALIVAEAPDGEHATTIKLLIFQ